MNAKIIENYMERVWKEKDLSAIDQFFAQDAVVHSPLGEFHGPQSMKEAVQHWLTAFPDLIVTRVHATSEADRVVWQWTARGTHQGVFKGVNPTGRPVSYMGATTYRLEQGKIVEYWAYVDTAHVLSQLQQESAV